MKYSKMIDWLPFLFFGVSAGAYLLNDFDMACLFFCCMFLSVLIPFGIENRNKS